MIPPRDPNYRQRDEEARQAHKAREQARLADHQTRETLAQGFDDMYEQPSSEIARNDPLYAKELGAALSDIARHI